MFVQGAELQRHLRVLEADSRIHDLPADSRIHNLVDHVLVATLASISVFGWVALYHDPNRSLIPRIDSGSSGFWTQSDYNISHCQLPILQALLMKTSCCDLNGDLSADDYIGDRPLLITDGPQLVHQNLLCSVTLLLTYNEKSLFKSNDLGKESTQ